MPRQQSWRSCTNGRKELRAPTRVKTTSYRAVIDLPGARATGTGASGFWRRDGFTSKGNSQVTRSPHSLSSSALRQLAGSPASAETRPSPVSGSPYGFPSRKRQPSRTGRNEGGASALLLAVGPVHCENWVVSDGVAADQAVGACIAAARNHHMPLTDLPTEARGSLLALSAVVDRHWRFRTTRLPPHLPRTSN